MDPQQQIIVANNINHKFLENLQDDLVKETTSTTYDKRNFLMQIVTEFPWENVDNETIEGFFNPSERELMTLPTFCLVNGFTLTSMLTLIQWNNSSPTVSNCQNIAEQMFNEIGQNKDNYQHFAFNELAINAWENRLQFVNGDYSLNSCERLISCPTIQEIQANATVAVNKDGKWYYQHMEGILYKSPLLPVPSAPADTTSKSRKRSRNVHNSDSEDDEASTLNRRYKRIMIQNRTTQDMTPSTSTRDSLVDVEYKSQPYPDPDIVMISEGSSDEFLHPSKRPPTRIYDSDSDDEDQILQQFCIEVEPTLIMPLSTQPLPSATAIESPRPEGTSCFLNTQSIESVKSDGEDSRKSSRGSDTTSSSDSDSCSNEEFVQASVTLSELSILSPSEHTALTILFGDDKYRDDILGKNENNSVRVISSTRKVIKQLLALVMEFC